MYPTFPIAYDSIRKTLVDQVQQVTFLTCIVEEPETQNVPRPNKPYFSLKFISPGIKSGDDSAQNISGTTKWVRGGQRKVVVDFNCYGRSHEESYNYMALLQASFELETVQENLRLAGIAVWLNGSVKDVSKLLNTAFEGRSQMDVSFGIASNLTEDLSSIDTINVSGSVTTDQNEVVNITGQVIAP